MNAFIDELRLTFRLADAIDIGIVAMLIYGVMSWIRDRAIRVVGCLLIGIVVVYWLARWLKLYLTTMAFEYGILGAVFAFVLIFQQDIRRGFERFLSWQWSRRTDNESADTVVDTLAEVVSHLAGRRIGALLVFPGRESVERHVGAGVPVDARISLPLLCSIFHPESPGHDGAVTIREDRVAQLGVHLPLSRNVSKTPTGGTRHAAALGLAERCDALIVAVSEERGTISLAHNDQLTEVSAEQLREQLQHHYRGQLQLHNETPARQFKNISRKCVSLLSACALWFMFANQTEMIQRTLVVPVEYRDVPEPFIVDDPDVTLAEVTIRGSEQAFRVLDAAQVALSLDLANARAGSHTYSTSINNVTNLPNEFEVISIKPDHVSVSVRSNPGTAPAQHPDSDSQ